VAESGIGKRAWGRRRKPRSFYGLVLAAADLADFEQARAIEGIQDEVGLLRLRLRDLMGDKHSDDVLILRMVEALSRMTARSSRLPRSSMEELAASMRAVLIAAGMDINLGAREDAEDGAGATSSRPGQSFHARDDLIEAEVARIDDVGVGSGDQG